MEKQDRLNEALRAAEDFERGIAGLVGWIDQQCRELAAQSEPSEDVATLQQQIELNKVIWSYLEHPLSGI